MKWYDMINYLVLVVEFLDDAKIMVQDGDEEAEIIPRDAQEHWRVRSGSLPHHAHRGAALGLCHLDDELDDRRR